MASSACLVCRPFASSRTPSVQIPCAPYRSFPKRKAPNVYPASPLSPPWRRSRTCSSTTGDGFKKPPGGLSHLLRFHSNVRLQRGDGSREPEQVRHLERVRRGARERRRPVWVLLQVRKGVA